MKKKKIKLKEFIKNTNLGLSTEFFNLFKQIRFSGNFSSLFSVQTFIELHPIIVSNRNDVHFDVLGGHISYYYLLNLSNNKIISDELKITVHILDNLNEDDKDKYRVESIFSLYIMSSIFNISAHGKRDFFNLMNSDDKYQSYFRELHPDLKTKKAISENLDISLRSLSNA